MIEKKSILLIASAAALTLALHEPALSAPPTGETTPPPAEPPGTAEPAKPTVAESADPGSEPVAQKSASAGESVPDSPQAMSPAPSAQPVAAAPPYPTDSDTTPTEPFSGTAAAPVAGAAEPPSPPADMTASPEGTEQSPRALMQEHARRYEDMGAPAGEYGPGFFEQPPWEQNAEQPPWLSAPPAPPRIEPPATVGVQPDEMTPEEQDALREEQYWRMRERVMQRHEEMRARWDSYWKTLDAMTPEQKEAVQAVLGARQGWCPHSGMGGQMPPGMPAQPLLGQPEYGFPSGPTFPGPGPSFVPRHTEPSPYERGPGPSWLDDQPVHPGAAQPW